MHMFDLRYIKVNLFDAYINKEDNKKKPTTPKCAVS